MLKVEPAANDVQVIVEEAWEGAAPPEADDTGVCSSKRQVFASSDGREPAVLDGDSARRRIGTIERREQATMHDEIGCTCYIGQKTMMPIARGRGDRRA
jgi:hypothetical protein